MNIEAPKEMLNIGALNEIAISIEGDAEAAPNALLDTQNRIYSEAGDPKSTSNTIELEDDQPLEGDSGWMYKAASEGDWAAAETILRRDPDLFWVEKSEEIRQTALHLAVKGKHTDFIRKLTRWIGTNDVDDLCLRDGNGYTACCYAAMDGNVEHVRIMMEANPSVLDVQNSKGTTPFELLVSNRNPKTVPHFLSVTTIEDLMSEKWFRRFREVLLKKRMFDVALEFLENEKRVALLTDVGHDDRTALHILAGIDLSRGWKVGARVEMEANFDLLAQRLWSEILKYLGRELALDLVKGTLFGDQDRKPHSLLHDAAKANNLKLINMIIDDFPHLLSHIDEDGSSLLHIIVMNRRDKNIIELLKKSKGVEDHGVFSLDKDGNNILHAAAKSIYPEGLEILAEQDFEMQRAFALFKTVEEIGHPDYGEMKNNEGYRPIDLFWKEHAKMLSTSETYLKRTSESCMLISTIVLTLVFAAAFAPPGGFNQDTGIPILLKRKLFTSFIVFELLALCSSTFSIIGFWSIITSKTKEYQFFVWPRYLRYSMCALLLSVLFVVSAFLSAFMLVFVRERRVVAMSFILLIYVSLVVVIFYQVLKVLQKTNRHSLLDPNSSKRNTLWRRVYGFAVSIFSFFGSCFSCS